MKPHPTLFLRVAAIMTIAATAVLAQAPAPAPAFDVVVIKPFVLNATSISSMGMTIDKARVHFRGFPLQMVIDKAYNVKPYQVSGPAWLNIDPFDIEATLPAGATEDQIPLMFQAMLADRFKMTVHRENREQSVYAIVVDKGGLKLKEKEPSQEPSAPEPPLPPGATVLETPTGKMIVSKGDMTFTLAGGDLKMHVTDDGVHFEASKISSLAEFLSGTGRPVVDKTNLKGSYQIDFKVSDQEMDDPAAAAAFSPQGGGGAPVASTPVDPAAFFRTVLKKIGLNVESQKAPVEMLVIDHIEKTPSEN